MESCSQSLVTLTPAEVELWATPQGSAGPLLLRVLCTAPPDLGPMKSEALLFADPRPTFTGWAGFNWLF